MAKKKLKVNKNQQYLLIIGALILLFVMLLVFASFAFSSILFATLKSAPSSCMSNVNCRMGLEEAYRVKTVVFATILSIIALLGMICFTLLFSGRSKNIDEKRHELVKLTNSLAIGIVKMKKSGDNYYIQYANDGFYRLIGYSRKEYLAKYNNEVLGCAYLNDLDGVKEILRENEDKNRITLEFRVVNRFSNIRWVLVNAVKNEQSYLCAFTDITKSKMVEDELQLNNDRLHIVIGNMHDMIFEYNLITQEFTPISEMDDLNCVSNWQALQTYQLVSDKDVEKLRDMVNEARAGKKYQSSRFRIKNNHEKWIWCELSLTTLFDSTNMPVRVIGKMMNIDKQIREKELLIQMSQKDPMTLLLNKTVAQDYIEAYMDSGNCGAILLLDIDDFKQINDTYGHIYGDKVIKYFATQLSKLFRQDDIVSRLGGDEFLIFMKHCHDEKLIRDKVEELNHLLLEFEVEGVTNALTSSVGVAFYVGDDETYDELVKRADKAMYHGKRHGKGQCVFYKDNLESEE